MDRNDYVKYLTEEMVKYMQMSKQEKKQRKAAKPSKKSAFYWFGIIPFALRMIKKKHKTTES
ncbi:YqzE-like protein [Halobacillus alkaliphilus]|uniref:YqzE-like protein n=1 Tax=Halobacillus alkaliphilus TaxID=396056 RepID=A0A1I2JJD9_9BACI|nr:YqzE family protein [Halobacillus alkaliphilus]SFF54208.1 YqzE-like protein [Halobacillus alkaliphilus]